MDTNTQIERLIELAIVQRTELKRLVEELPQLKEHLSAEIERTFEETEPQLRAELEEWTSKQAADKTAALGVALESKIASLAKSLEESAQAKFSAVLAARDQNADLLKQAEERIAVAASEIPGKVKEIVTAELARFPRAGEIDRLRKEFQEPRGLNPRGKWLPDQTYNKLDLVTVNGDSYVSNVDGNTEKPGRNATNWTLSAARGGYGGGGGITSLTDVLNVPTSGQIIGSQNGQYVPKTLVAGANITINETANSITIIGDEGQISLNDGTAASPALFFTNDTDTGLYRPAANTLGVAVGGAQVAYFDANGITTVGAGATFDGSVHAANGNANNPSLSFTGDDNTGFFRHQPDEIGITLGGTQTGTLTSALATLTSKLLVSSGATTTAATDLLVNPAVKASGNLLDLQVASSSKFSVSSAGNATLSGNLTVSGGTARFQDPTNSYGVTITTAAAKTLVETLFGGSSLGIRVGGSGSDSLTIASTGATIRDNLTVSGGTVTGGTSGLSLASGGTNQNITLTPSGTGATVISKAETNTNAITTALNYLKIQNTSSAGTYIGALEFYTWDNRRAAGIFANRNNVDGTSGILSFAYSTSGNSFAEGFRLNHTGNFLLGTTTDGGQKLQVNGTALFGTDNASLGAYFDYNGGISGNATLWLRQTTKSSSTYTLTGGGTYTALNAPSGGSIYLRINNSDALTLDSSLNATFAGKAILDGVNSVLVVKGANPTGVASSTIVDYAGGSRIISYGSTTGTASGFSFVGLSSNGSVGGTRFSIGSAGDATFAAGVDVGAGSYLAFTNRSAIRSSADGLIRLTNWADNDFTRLQFGGTTASFPALGRNGNALDCLLADSSGYANIRAERFVIASGTVQLISGTNSPEGVITANVGSLFLRTNGGASTTLYVKESGTGNTGWVAK